MALGKRLGRGLDDILAPKPVSPEERVELVPIDRLTANPDQPRKAFDPEKLQELMDSIREHGVMQPLIVRPRGDGQLEIVAGERRYRACRELGRDAVPAIIRAIPDERMLELALVENIQRDDLNPIEKGHAYKQLIDSFGLTQEAAAARLGQQRSTLANFLRLLDLPEPVQELVSRETLSAGHARAVLMLPTPDDQTQFAQKIVSEGLSVRQAEELATHSRQTSHRRRKPEPASANIRDLEEKLRHTLGTRVQIKVSRSKPSKGKIVIEFYTNDDFSRILEVMGVSVD